LQKWERGQPGGIKIDDRELWSKIETWGRGIQRIFAACKEAGTPRPALTFDGTGLALEFRYTREYLKAMNAPETPTAPVTEQVTEQVGGLESGLESWLESILHRSLQALASLPLSKSEIAAAIGQQTASGKLHERIRQMLAAGLIERTLPGKPNSRLQKYRLTAQGRAWLSRHPH